MTPELRKKKRKAGLALVAKYGREHMAWMGRRGGRPTWQEAIERANQRESDRRAAATERRRAGPARPSGQTKATP